MVVIFLLLWCLFGEKQYFKLLHQLVHVIFLITNSLCYALWGIFALLIVGKDKGEREILVFFWSYEGKVVGDISFHEFIEEIFGSFFECIISVFIELFFGSSLAGFIILYIVHFLLIPIKDSVHLSLKDFEKDGFHLVGDFVEEASNILVLIKGIEKPPESFIDPHDVVMQVIQTSTVVVSELFGEDVDKGGVRLEVVEGVDYLLEIKVDVGIKVLESDRMCDLVLALPLLGQDDNQCVQVFNDQGDFLTNDLSAQIFLYFGRVVQLVDVMS